MSKALSFDIRHDEINERLDPNYFHPILWNYLKKLEKSPYQIKRIGDISKVVTKGESPLWRGDKFAKEGIPFLRGVNVKKGEVTLENVTYITENVHKRMKRSQLKPGNILLSMAGTLGDVAVVPESLKKANINQDLAKIVLKEGINPHYVAIFLDSTCGKLQVERKSDGMTRKHINFLAIKSIKIPLPPREIQDKITQIMQAAYKKKKEKLKKAVDLLNQINDYVLEKLGIETTKIKEKRSFIVAFDNLKTKGRHDVFYYRPKYASVERVLEDGGKKNYELKDFKKIIKHAKKGIEVGSKAYRDKGVPFLRVENIEEYNLNFEAHPKYIDEETYKNLRNNYEPQVGEILFTKDGTIGRALKVSKRIKGIVSGGILRIALRGEVCAEYIVSILNNPVVRLQAERNSIGAIIKHLSLENVYKLKIPLPPLEIQNEIAEEVQRRRQMAEQLKREAEGLVREAKGKVEKMILGG